MDDHRRFGAAVTELIAAYASSLGTRKVAPPATPAELSALFDGPMPLDGVDGIEILRDLQRDAFEHSMTIASPRYFGLFNPAPLPTAVWVDALCSALNQNGAAWRQSPSVSALEACLIRWLAELLGYPDSAFGTLTSGGSEANLIALKCAGPGWRQRS